MAKNNPSPKSTSENWKPNILLIAVDSLLADRMSCYGHNRLTTPHIDKFAKDATLFERTYCPHVPTTSAYASMQTGRDCFGTSVVALGHQGGLPKDVPTLAEICRKSNYETTCVGFGWNPSSRGFDNYIEYPSWGNWEAGRSPKAQNLNEVAQPELARLGGQYLKTGKPFFAMLRHMDPHSPYLPPEPFDRLFYYGNECDPKNKSLDPVYKFKPFADYFRTWFPPGCTDKEYIIAQYDGAVAYMDACIGRLFTQLDSMGILDDTIVILNGDHGETLHDHECWYDHHGMYDVCLHVPLIIRYPRKVPMGRRIDGYNEHKHLVPTLMELAGIRTRTKFDGPSLMQLVRGDVTSFDSEMYITECTWMRKHGWRTPQWKLIIALEPDFHFKPEVELYDLITDPEENHNVAEQHPDVVKGLRGRMEAWIAKREQETGRTNPMFTQGDWHGHKGLGAFKSSEQAYETLHIGDAKAAAKLQSKLKTGADGDDKVDKNRLFATVIGRGHGGTRVISHTLAQSGFYMGNTLNSSGDLVPPNAMYEACRIMAKQVKHKGGLEWDFSRLHTKPIDPAFTKLIEAYLDSVLNSPAKLRGWKIPETTLCYPWLVRMFPDLHYIHWVRDPRDAILGGHVTDDLSKFGIHHDPTDDILVQRAISWKYQAALVKTTPKPERLLSVRFEDFVLNQDDTLGKISDFLGTPLVKIAVKPEAVGRWKTSADHREIDFLQDDLKELGYLESKPVTKKKRVASGKKRK